MFVYNQGMIKIMPAFRFIPNYFGSDYVKGKTNLTVTFHLPPGIQPDEPRWEKMASSWPGSAEPQTGFDAEDRITYTWQSDQAKHKPINTNLPLLFLQLMFPPRKSILLLPLLLTRLFLSALVFRSSSWLSLDLVSIRLSGDQKNEKCNIFHRRSPSKVMESNVD